ncbi:ribosome hibernation-promoting factor, HPF/YfiA family [Agaribacterium sp. ZY112]|uniref:ribosome hibernation-promoting factor, HPF/YfiA family n=1 Tax=Agaribacterium sp. ZY112 TaxID=3233574 RepID=UPI0035235D28
MRVEVSGHHIQATEALREAIGRKLERINKHFPNVGRVNAKLKVDKNQHQIELDTLYLGKHLSVKASGKNMYAAIASASPKLHEALSRQKEHNKARRHDNSESNWQKETQETSDVEDTYAEYDEAI